MPTVPAFLKKQRLKSPLLYPAVVLSLASLAWTTWSLVDLLGTGLIGVTVAAGADIIWGAVIIAEARGLQITARIKKLRLNLVPLFGWAALLVVAGFLAWHGLAQNAAAMAAAGPFLPLGAKVVWLLALADMRDPAALTHDELHQLAAMERGMTFEEAQHDIRLRRQRMDAEFLLNEVSTDFDIEISRQDRERELMRRRPLALPPAVRLDANETANDANATSTAVRPTDREPFASLTAETTTEGPANDGANDANTAGHATRDTNSFGFGAVLADTKPFAPETANGSPRKANAKRTANDTSDANGDQANANKRSAATADYHASVKAGTPISGAALGRKYGCTARWGQLLIAELKQS